MSADRGVQCVIVGKFFCWKVFWTSTTRTWSTCSSHSLQIWKKEIVMNPSRSTLLCLFVVSVVEGMRHCAQRSNTVPLTSQRSWPKSFWRKSLFQAKFVSTTEKAIRGLVADYFRLLSGCFVPCRNYAIINNHLNKSLHSPYLPCHRQMSFRDRFEEVYHSGSNRTKIDHHFNSNV